MGGGSVVERKGCVSLPRTRGEKPSAVCTYKIPYIAYAFVILYKIILSQDEKLCQRQTDARVAELCRKLRERVDKAPTLVYDGGSDSTDASGDLAECEQFEAQGAAGERGWGKKKRPSQMAGGGYSRQRTLEKLDV